MCWGWCICVTEKPSTEEIFCGAVCADLPVVFANASARFAGGSGAGDPPLSVLRSGCFNSAKILMGNALMLQAWVPERLLRIDSPSWSLCGEAFFYLCFPALGVVLWRLRGARLWMAAVAVYVGGQMLVWAVRPHLSGQTGLYLPLLHLSTFALGILLARWQKVQQERKRGEPARLWQVNLVLGLSVAGVDLKRASAAIVQCVHAL